MVFKIKFNQNPSKLRLKSILFAKVKFLWIFKVSIKHSTGIIFFECNSLIRVDIFNVKDKFHLPWIHLDLFFWDKFGACWRCSPF